MNFLSRIISIGVLFISTTVLYAEYIVVKSVQGKLNAIEDAEEYTTIYKILMTYQWPMLIGHAKKLPIEELRELTKTGIPAEEHFLRKKLKEVSPDLDLIFIPTLLYELLAIQYYNSAEESALQELIQIGYRLEDVSINKEVINTIGKKPDTNSQTLYDIFLMRNNLPQVRQAHQEMNKFIFKFFLSIDSELKPDTFLIKNYNNLLVDITKFYKDIFSRSYFEYFKNFEKVKKLTDFEIKMHNENRAYLYRAGRDVPIYIVGTKGDDKIPIEIYFMASDASVNPTYEDLVRIYNRQAFIGEKKYQWNISKRYELLTSVEQSLIPLASVSYGNSLLAGYFNDITACAAYYIGKQPNRIGYALEIDKISFLTGNLKTLLNLSLFNTIMALCAKGEFFHSRSISYLDPQFYEYKKSEREPFKFAGLAHPIFDYAGLYIRPGNYLQKAYEFSSYIQTHANVFKVRSVEGTAQGFFPYAGKIEKYETTQEQVTNMLKAMVIMKKIISRRLGKIKEHLTQLKQQPRRPFVPIKLPEKMKVPKITITPAPLDFSPELIKAPLKVQEPDTIGEE